MAIGSLDGKVTWNDLIESTDFPSTDKIAAYARANGVTSSSQFLELLDKVASDRVRIKNVETAEDCY